MISIILKALQWEHHYKMCFFVRANLKRNMMRLSLDKKCEKCVLIFRAISS